MKLDSVFYVRENQAEIVWYDLSMASKMWLANG